ncbi:MAG: response regulator [Candidatus Omnitrophica bacterium]|nr:response regulator [Candidatus Omnitrophota bacterium]MCB9747154.1 response regulator [Candidatus Omnitrophota bacterium]
MKKEKILTIDDDPDILDVLDLTLSEYYEISQAGNGKEGLDAVQQKIPDLIVCDYMMPVMNGREFCKALKQDILLRHIPVIMLTGKGEVQDRIGGIEAGADDYIVKPFAPDELLARIKMILKRTIRSLDASPLTHLPGNTSITEEFQRHIDEKKPFAVGYADLDKFKAYNDKYGFEKGDDVIKELARILIQDTRKIGNAETFVGHIGGDDFVFIADDAIIDNICENVVKDFDDKVPSFYNEEDYERGYILGKDRQGNEQRFGLLAVSIGIVSNVNQSIKHVAQIGEVAAELKKYAKSFEKSNYVRDKRQNGR